MSGDSGSAALAYRFGPSLEVRRHRLDNGLTVLVLVDDTAPVVAYQTWLAVGSRHERDGKTGIAHLFEHLMFNEAEGLPYGEFDRRLEEAGAESNAATFLDWTYYMENLPKDALELVVDLEARRLRSMVLKKQQLESEREVVSNERRQTVEDDIDGSVIELLYMTAFDVHGYRHPTIGSMQDIQGLTLEDCKHFYATYYAPNNATLVVVGDVVMDQVLELVRARYADMPAATIPPEARRDEPEQTEERRVRVTKPTAAARMALGYKSPAMGHADHVPLLLLNEILFGGRSSRVHRRLVQQLEIASEVHGSVGSFRDPSLWDMYLTGREGVDPAALGEALDAVLDGVIADGVSEAELVRARARFELATLSGLETASGKAEQIGYCEVVLGDPAAVFSRLDQARAATLADLERVARRTLRRNARTVVEVIAAHAGDGEAA